MLKKIKIFFIAYLLIISKTGFTLMIDKNSLNEITIRLNEHKGEWSSQEVNDLLTNYIDLNRITYNSKLEHKDVEEQEMGNYNKEQTNDFDDIINQVLNTTVTMNKTELRDFLYSKLFLVNEKLNFCIENKDWTEEVEKQKEDIIQIISNIREYQNQESFSLIIKDEIIQNQIKSIINYPSTELLTNIKLSENSGDNIFSILSKWKVKE